MIIDVHLHTNFRDERLLAAARESKVDFSPAGLEREMALAGVSTAVSIRANLPAIETRAMAEDGCAPGGGTTNPKILDVAFINPLLPRDGQYAAMHTLLDKRQVAGIKIYLGYYHFFPSDPVYTPYYDLAADHNVPVIFHTGDTFSPVAKLKYARPLLVDDVAVDFPKTTFIIAHFGFPWVWDAAEVVDKNENVYADLSGMFEADKRHTVPVARVKAAMENCEYQRLMYGSDWPIVAMQPYRAFVDSLIPKDHVEDTFYNNAATVFHAAP